MQGLLKCHEGARDVQSVGISINSSAWRSFRQRDAEITASSPALLHRPLCKTRQVVLDPLLLVRAVISNCILIIN